MPSCFGAPQLGSYRTMSSMRSKFRRTADSRFRWVYSAGRGVATARASGRHAGVGVVLVVGNARNEGGDGSDAWNPSMGTVGWLGLVRAERPVAVVNPSCADPVRRGRPGVGPRPRGKPPTLRSPPPHERCRCPEGSWFRGVPHPPRRRVPVVCVVPAVRAVVVCKRPNTFGQTVGRM